MNPSVRPGRIAVHAALILYTLFAIGPIVLIIMNWRHLQPAGTPYLPSP